MTRSRGGPQRWSRALLVAGFAILAGVAVAASGAALTARTPHLTGPTSYATVKAATTPPVAAFIGDSYTAGVGASAKSKRWTTLVAASQGWEEDNLGRGGTGYLTTAGLQGCGRAVCPNYQGMLSDVSALKPDIVVVAGGQLDQVQDPAKESAAIAAFYRSLRSRLPDAKIIAVGPSSPDATPGTHIDAIDKEVRAAATAIGATYVELLHPSVIAPSMVLADNTHVNDAGHAAIAARVEAALN